MNLLKAFFQQNGFNDADTELIISNFSFKQIKKGEHFVEDGKTSKWLGYIEQGYFQYYINLEGEEKTTYSLGPNNLVASLVSFLKQVPARENIRAVSNSTMWIISKEAFQNLRNVIPAFNQFYIGLLEWQICCIEESRIDGIVLSALQRYEKMLNKEPQIIQQVPLHYLASMLGVTPRHLSRIRNNIC
ncbi:MAG: Crp/Fnr family transcriptional regulator [Bacteroidota bacterium]